MKKTTPKIRKIILIKLICIEYFWSVESKNRIGPKKKSITINRFFHGRLQLLRNIWNSPGVPKIYSADVVRLIYYSYCYYCPLTVVTEIEKFITANTQELAKDKWLCPLSGKKFKGPEFVRKHILTKHVEKLDELKKDVSLSIMYLCVMSLSFTPLSLHMFVHFWKFICVADY